mmetsp:Transcript_14447/g.37019  ORF Transcript_14447/g.37019 Transcript_14447/m.37019 type:complete len:924 (-) Transcript_14447:239-3010(-)
MGFGLQWIVDKITFPSPPSSYSLTSHPELFFVKSPKSRPSYPGVPCMLYTIPQGAPVLLVHAHSNGCDIGDMRQTLQSISESLRVHVMSFEFPGYGLHVGSASMRSIDEAAVAVADFLINELKVNIAQVVWYGRSIGSGPAVRMVHRITKELGCQPGGVILQCGYANFPEVAGHLFGRMAKQLVSPLWKNEAMVKELRCPVLLIHGRNDTMIPIEQSEKLWNAVAMKELSHFHSCDCGHNDFNFRRCTLRPIYDFLLGVISSPSFPSTNFYMSISSSSHAYVHHIGPLRSKIPVYSFRRPELEEWTRKLHAVHTGNPTGNEADEPMTPSELLKAEGRELKVQTKAQGGATGGRAPSEGQSAATSDTGPTDSKRGTPANAKKGKKGKGKPEVLPFPDFTTLPPVEDIVHAFTESEGMVRTCAQRVSGFLERLQRQLDRVDGLESKPLDEVVEMVEAEFWASDPLLCLWEEVRQPHGDRMRLRFGPFAIDNTGHKSYEPELQGSSSPEWLRIPVWVFTPSPAHFRCLAEWSLLHSERLERNLPAATGTGSSSGCCCVPSSGLRKKKRMQSSRKRGDIGAHPSKGVLATSFAAHFVNWVERTDEIRSLFARFVSLYQSPEEALRRPIPSSSNPSIPLGAFPLPPKDLPSDILPTSPGSSSSKVGGELEEELVSPPHATTLGVATVIPAKVQVPGGDYDEEVPVDGTSRSPRTPAAFSTAARAMLREGLGTVGGNLEDLLVAIKTPGGTVVASRLPEILAEDSVAILNICEFSTMSQAASSPVTQLLPERHADWAVAAFLLHYERQLWGASATGEVQTGSCEAEAWGDPVRLEMRKTGQAVNRSIKVFAQVEHQRKRESQRSRGINPPASRIPRQPQDPNGDPDVPAPRPLASLQDEGASSMVAEVENADVGARPVADFASLEEVAA